MTDDDIPPVPSHGFATPAEVAELRATIAGLEARVEALTGIADAAKELAEYASYSEIVGQIGVNRPQIRRECDRVFSALRAYAALPGGTPDAP